MRHMCTSHQTQLWSLRAHFLTLRSFGLSMRLTSANFRVLRAFEPIRRLFPLSGGLAWILAALPASFSTL